MVARSCPSAGPTPGTALRVLLVALLVAGTLAPAVPASPRPVPVCGPCERGFTAAAEANGLDAAVERSISTMRVHENRSATWTVENRLNPAAAERLRRNDSLRQAVATEAIEMHEARLLSTSVEGDTLRMRYRTPDVATESTGGVLLVTYFRDDPGATVYTGLGADRLTLVAPDGMVVGDSLPGAEVSGRRTTVTSFESRGDGPFVTLVPEGSALGPLWSFLAVAGALAPVVGRNLLLLVAIPALVFAGGLSALAWGTGRAAGDAARSLDAGRVAHAVTLLGVVLLAHPLFAGAVSILGGSTPALFAAAAGLVTLGAALAVPAVRRGMTVQRLAGLVALSFGVAVAVGFLLRALSLGSLAFHERASVLRNVAPALPVYAAVVTGYAAARGEFRRGLLVAVAALVGTLVASFPIAAHGGTLYLLGVMLAVGGALVAVVAGAPLFVLGYALPSAESARAGESD